MKKLIVNVTADDIARGKRRDPDCCPVAYALKTATGNQKAWAGDRTAYKSEFVEIGDFPIDVVERIKQFDDYLEMEPFTFELEINE